MTKVRKPRYRQGEEACVQHDADPGDFEIPYKECPACRSSFSGSLLSVRRGLPLVFLVLLIFGM